MTNYAGTGRTGSAMKKELLNNIKKIHTTELGILRIKNNLGLETDDVVNWCKRQLKKSKEIVMKGKNWYIYRNEYIITINANNYTIITAHRRKKCGIAEL